MSEVEKSVVVNVPLNTAYNQWTQFEEFPKFMDGVRSVKQLDDKHLHWDADIYGKDEQWDAEIVEQVPDSRIAWRSISGAQNDGVVTFQSEEGTKTRVTLVMTYNPEGLVENVGNWLGFVDRRIEADLKRFKEFIESQGSETGAWRGEIQGSQVKEKSNESGRM